jgi:hypothetical protein
MFKIEDERHAEPQDGAFNTLDEALAELRRRSAVPWNEPPNQAPCVNWHACGRSYEIIEYDVSADSWKEVRRIPALDVSAQGVKWAAPFSA